MSDTKEPDMETQERKVHQFTRELPDSNDCRMYENEYPEVEDLVIVQVFNVAEMGAYVNLLEYNNAEGMVLLSELSRRRIRSINKEIRVGRIEITTVLRVDKEKGYVDLSKRRVSREDIARCQAKYEQSKAVHSIMRYVSETLKIPRIELYEHFVWDLYKRYDHAFTALQYLIREDTSILKEYNLPDDVIRALLKVVRRKMAPKPTKLRADLEVTCFSYEGIDAIKTALKAGVSVGTEEVPIRIKLVAPPLYVLLATALDKASGLKLLQDAIDTIREEVTKRGGDAHVKHEPFAVSERDDKMLQTLMADMEKQNAEVSGDCE